MSTKHTKIDVITQDVCMCKRRDGECQAAQRHQEGLIKFWTSLWILVL